VTTVAFRISAILWAIWGAVHILAGVLTVSAPDAAASVAGIVDAVDPAAIAGDYHPAAKAILDQHGWNLGWIGLTTLVCSLFVWRGSVQAIFLAALVGGLADIGYFVFLDLGGFVNVVPGTVMTIFSGSAIVLSFFALYQQRKA